MVKDSDLPMIISLIAGGTAGITVDMTLFPLDTLKTRLQSPSGFFGSGGFRHLYKGIGTAAVGSIPTASVFFCTYDTIKKTFSKQIQPAYLPVMHMAAASLGEIGACVIKVPFEVVKQRQQAALEKLSPILICKRAVEAEGLLGLYRGFTTTVLREIPFVLIQFPLWEWMKTRWYCVKKEDLNAIEVAVCGALSGGVAAAVTTPLDVTKTRIMLAEKNIHSEADSAKLRTFSMFTHIYKEQGIKGLFAGFLPRTLWITLGGAVFFGAYQATVDSVPKLNGKTSGMDSSYRDKKKKIKKYAALTRRDFAGKVLRHRISN